MFSNKNNQQGGFLVQPVQSGQQGGSGMQMAVAVIAIIFTVALLSSGEEQADCSGILTADGVCNPHPSTFETN